NAALGLIEPMSCGVGADLHALVWDARAKQLHALNASGRSPYRATRQLFAEKGLNEIPMHGPLSWSVPGCVDGWEQLRSRFGSMTLADLLEPTIRYAEDGFPVTEVIAGTWHAATPLLRASADAARTYLPHGRSPSFGEVFRNRNLAQTYRELTTSGPESFYRGRIAQQIIAFSERVGGLFALEDFADHTSTWVDPVSTTYRGHEVWQLPPPTQGVPVLQMLNLLEGFELQALGPQ